MKRSRLIINRAMNGVAGMIFVLTLIPLMAFVVVLAASIYDDFRTKYAEHNLSLCPFCEQPVRY